LNQHDECQQVDDFAFDGMFDSDVALVAPGYPLAGLFDMVKRADDIGNYI